MKYLVYITPESGVGGEWPRPLSFSRLYKARNYARACRLKGMKTRIVKER